MKPTEQQVREWIAQIKSDSGEAYTQELCELAARWGAEQAQQTTEPELPVAVAHISDPDAFDAYEVIPVFTATQMHDYFAAGVRSGMGQSQDALGYAQRLAKSIASKEYPEVTQFEVLGDLMGVLSQIDNMTCGMTRVLQGGQQ